MAGLRSFRLRIVLLATLLSGGVLAALGAGAQVGLKAVRLDWVDAQLLNLVHGPLTRPGPPPDWNRVGESLALFLGDEEGPAYILYVVERGGHVLHQSENWPAGLDPHRFAPAPEGAFEAPEAPPRPGLRPGMRPPPLARPVFLNLRADEAAYRFVVIRNERVAVALGRDMRSFEAEGARLAGAILLSILAGLLLIAAGGYFLAERALRPVRVITRTAERVTAKGLHERIAIAGADGEFQRLVNVFNQMLDRLERSFHQATRFSADAAHELQTPLAILQGQLEQAIQEAESASQEQENYGKLLEEVQRLKAIIRKLLLLARADGGRLEVHKQTVDLSRMVEAVCEDIAVIAPELKVHKKVQSGLTVEADPDLLRQVVQNLVNNAIKYNEADGEIRLRLRDRKGRVTLDVANTGPGIPEGERSRVFERFFRADKARSRDKDGVGLGLSLAREIARAHGGDLVLERADRAWTVFALTL